MYVIGTAGHVDHGKSALVEALTGIDPDRLAEEKSRGMTIDLGFAWLTLPDGRIVSIVDVPGHERFIKNMLAGAGGIDLALLVVAADDGVMPQTREHLAILDLLGVSRGVVALTKCDLATADWLDLVETDISDLIAGTSLSGSPIVRCSAVTGDGMDDLLAAVAAALDALPPKRDVARPRLPIDRVFTIGGFGTVVTGTLVDGELRVGDEVELLPGGLRARIRGLQSHRQAVERASPGTRTAVNLSGVPKDALRRGMVLAFPGAVRTTTVVDARVRSVAGRPLRHNLSLTFHVAADEANAQLRLLESDAIEPGREAWAQIKLDREIVAARGDRFVLRTPDDTVAGGVIVDVATRRHRRHDAAVLAALARLLSDDPADLVLEAIERAPLANTSVIAADTGLPADIVDSALAALTTGRVIAIDADGEPRFATPATLASLERAAHAQLDAHHASHPLRPGMPIEELRSRLRLDPRQLAALLARMPSLRVHGAGVALSSFQPRPTPEQETKIASYLEALRQSPGHPPPNGGLSPDLLAWLAEQRLVVDAGDGIIFDAAAYDAMRERVADFIRAHGSITLAQARDLLGTGRRHAQALLETLDRAKITRRVGDERVLR